MRSHVSESERRRGGASESERVRVTVDVVSVRKHRGQICKLNDHTSENTNTGTRSK